MSHTKGQWVARDSAIGVVSDADDQSFGMMLAVAYVEQYDMPDEWEYNAKRIVDCVNACDGMDSPADEIAKLRSERDELLRVMVEIKADCDEASSYGDKVCVATLEIDRVLELCVGK